MHQEVYGLRFSIVNCKKKKTFTDDLNSNCNYKRIKTDDMEFFNKQNVMTGTEHLNVVNLTLM